MKLLFCLVLTCFFKFNLLAQVIGIADLVKMSKLNNSEIEAFLNDKGCMIERIDSQKYSTTLIYVHHSPTFWVGISDFGDCKIFYCDFGETTFYNSQKARAIKLGFRYVNQEVYNSTTADGESYKSINYKYKDAKNAISFITQIFDDHIQYEIAYRFNCSN